MINNDCIIINTDNCEVPKEGGSIYESRRNVAKLSNINSESLVSILVIAYNRLEKTRNCVESILKYTSDVNYELILVDNGSSDGTLEYFKSICYDNKKIIRITKNLQLSFGILQGTKYCSGMYIAFLNNDMIVTHNWLSNIMKCFHSDERIGMVCTASSNVSNFQDAGIVFNNLEDMQEKAKQYNISDPRKWHERLRLITCGTVYKRECIEICGNWDYGFFHDFADDDLTFRIRRAGYKTILCKDVFVHHDHNFSALDDEATQKYKESIKIGRENFKEKYFGIDAWEDTTNYENNMIALINEPNHSFINVLGIDVKCGIPILEVKNKLKDYNIFDTYLNSYTENAKYYIDLKTICEGAVFCDRIDFISEYFVDESFDYIILGKSINLYKDPYKVLTNILKMINKNGQIILKLRNTEDAYVFDNFVKLISSLNYRVDKIIHEQHTFAQEALNTINEFCKENNVDEDAYYKLVTKDYIISIVRNN